LDINLLEVGRLAGPPSVEMTFLNDVVFTRLEELLGSNGLFFIEVDGLRRRRGFIAISAAALGDQILIGSESANTSVRLRVSRLDNIEHVLEDALVQQIVHGSETFSWLRVEFFNDLDLLITAHHRVNWVLNGIAIDIGLNVPGRRIHIRNDAAAESGPDSSTTVVAD